MKQKWINKGDKVLVLSGNDKGSIGEVLAKKEDKVLVKGVNVRKRHMKAREQGQKSDIISMEKPIHISNVAICDNDGKKIKLNIENTKSGEKNLIYTKDGKKAVFKTLRKKTKTK